jgi:hypothetical protein
MPDLNLKFGDGSVPTYEVSGLSDHFGSNRFKGSVISRVCALLMSVISKITHLPFLIRSIDIYPFYIPDDPLDTSAGQPNPSAFQQSQILFIFSDLISHPSEIIRSPCYVALTLHLDPNINCHLECFQSMFKTTTFLELVESRDEIPQTISQGNYIHCQHIQNTGTHHLHCFVPTLPLALI